jgi:hypothetical protein
VHDKFKLSKSETLLMPSFALSHPTGRVTPHNLFAPSPQARRVHDKFKLSKSETVSFDDILNSGAVVGAARRAALAEEDEELNEMRALMGRSGGRERGLYDV